MAKSYFHQNEKLTVEVLRGKSKKPLFVTSVGMETAVAAEKINTMAGEFRIPALLKELDRLTKL